MDDACDKARELWDAMTGATPTRRWELERELLALYPALVAENVGWRAAQKSCELAVERAVDEVDNAFTWLEKFVDAAGGVNVCGEHSTAIGGGESNNPWANALEVFRGAVAGCDALLAACEAFERYSGENCQDDATTWDQLSEMIRAAIAKAKGN